MLKAIQKLVSKRREVEPHALITQHARLHRMLKSTLKNFLSPSHISLLEWSLLGMQNMKGEGVRHSSIAHELQIEASFVTELIKKMSKKGLVQSIADPQDRRAKIVQITTKGQQIMSDVQKRLEHHIADLFADASTSDFQGYLRVLEGAFKKQKDKQS